MFRALLLAALLSAAAAGCPNQWLPHVDHCFWLSTYTASWREARTACLALGTGSDLASIHDADENDAVTMGLLASDAWIGLSDLATEGTYLWTDGSSYDYHNWADGQPNNLLDQDCVSLMEDGSGTWDDNHCVLKKNFVCKMPGTK